MTERIGSPLTAPFVVQNGTPEGTPSSVAPPPPFPATSTLSSATPGNAYDCCGCIALLKAVANFIARPFISMFNGLMKWLGLMKEPESLQSLPSAGKITLPEELVGVIVSHCWNAGDIKGLSALACASRSLNRVVTYYTEIIDLDKWRPRNFAVIDTGASLNSQPNITKLVTELGIKKLAVLKCWFDLAPHVENDAGVSLLVMRKGCTYQSLEDGAKNDGMTVGPSSFEIALFLRAHRHKVPVDHTYAIMITNSVFENTRGVTLELQHQLLNVKSYAEKKQISYAEKKQIVVQHGCEMPILVEYVALCAFARKRLPECPYRLGEVGYGLGNRTYGFSSTDVDGDPLIVGGCTEDRLFIGRSDFSHEYNGAGGRRILASSNQTKSFWSFLGF